MRHFLAIKDSVVLSVGAFEFATAYGAHVSLLHVCVIIDWNRPGGRVENITMTY